MSKDFDIEELEKLPPAQRLAKIKELKEALQKRIEQEANKLEEESKHDLDEEQRQIDELLKRRIEEEKNLRDNEKQSPLEETVKKTPVEEKHTQIDYSRPPTSEYVLPQIKFKEDPFSKDVRGEKLKHSPYDSNQDYI